jgi:hypothetical protein
VQGSAANPAAGATLAGSAVVMPPLPTVPANNNPGKDVTPAAAPLVDQKVNLEQVYREGAAALAAMPTPRISAKTSAQPDIKADTPAPVAPVTPAVASVTTPAQPDMQAAEAAKPKRARKKANTVSMDGPEPEVVSSPVPTPEPAPAPAPAPVSAIVAPVVPAAAPVSAVVPTSGPAPAPAPDAAGKPTDAQMAEYRKRVSVFTSELPSSENMGSVQKMRAFITRMSGSAPQFMTTDQWEEMLGWFDSFVEKNQVKGLVKYINDSLGVK